ncbi:MAG: hypothetical protein DCC49_13380 [Acidobacteria bacterium]|nr:MAG: hypothetical protein DCC49_13380 [Acidobacteriota bacterium]
MTNKTEEPRLPPGWDEARIQEVLEHYESQTDEEMLAEDEAAFEAPDTVVMPIPNELADEVEALIERWEQQG